MKILPAAGGVRTMWEGTAPAASALAWLGQAGFAVRLGGLRLLIDPYLSDHLERKYRGTAQPHDRLMAAPVAAQELAGLDFVLCTHRHSDHMDPEALPKLAALHPRSRIVVPLACVEHTRRLGVPAAQLLGVDAGQPIALSPGVSLQAIPSAHETVETNERGEHWFLGYVLRAGSFSLYHSGDTVVYPGLTGLVAAQQPDLALLPVNGRGRGVAGNLTFPEAIQLCRDAAVPYLIPHHFGMFAFNTVGLDEVEALAARTSSPTCLLPTLERHWVVHPAA